MTEYITATSSRMPAKTLTTPFADAHLSLDLMSVRSHVASGSPILSRMTE
jgi:hypothetical protein